MDFLFMLNFLRESKIVYSRAGPTNKEWIASLLGQRQNAFVVIGLEFCDLKSINFSGFTLYKLPFNLCQVQTTCNRC